MDFSYHEINNVRIFELLDKSVTIRTSSEFLDLLSLSNTNILILHKEHFSDNFYDLKTGLAGDILQKVSNYSIKLGISGDFSSIKSKSLQAFIIESNRSNQVLFLNDKQLLMNRLSQ
jgi:hypothetical protein